MKNFERMGSWILLGVLTAGAGAQAIAQTRPAEPKPAASEAALTDQEVADAQTQLLKLLRMSPTLTTVVAHDPSLLADQAYVSRNNPELAQFLAAHPYVAQNPDFYLFRRRPGNTGQRDQELQRAIWPEFAEPGHPSGGLDAVMDKVAPMIVAIFFFGALVWIIRLIVENRRWGRTFKQQSEVHARLIDKFSSSQELAAYMETEAGKRFLEAAPIPIGIESTRRMPNAVARVLTPLQIGIVLVLLGVGLLLLRNVEPDMNVPMLVLGTLALMPGIGFILSAGVTWVLARRLGLMPEQADSEPVGPRERL
jgi:hypothetical protein